MGRSVPARRPSLRPKLLILLPRGGVLLEILSGGKPPGSPNPDPFSDQKMSLFTPVFRPGLLTGGPSSFHQRGRDSCLRAVLCYKRLFTKACMGCKRFFLKERKNVMFLNKINLPYCFVVFFVVCSRLRPF